MKITEQSLKLFLDLAKDAGNWSGVPPTDGNVSGSHSNNGNLIQLKKAGLITTARDMGTAWVYFTEAGKTLAAEHGVEVEVN